MPHECSHMDEMRIFQIRMHYDNRDRERERERKGKKMMLCDD